MTTRSGIPSRAPAAGRSTAPQELLTTRVVAELGELRAEWDALVDGLEVPSPFLRSWWLDHAAGPRPLFVLVLEGDTLLGGLALQRDRRWGVARLRVQGAGALCPDHVDLLAAPGREAAVTERLAAWLGARGSRVIDLEGVVEHARVKAALPPPAREEVVDVAPWGCTGPSATQWFAQLPASLRKTVRTASRRLGAAGVEHRIVADPGQAGAALEALGRLHAERWGRRSRFLGSFDRFTSAALAGMAQGEMVLHELASSDRVVGVLASFEVAGRASLYQWGRDPDPAWGGLGPVLLAHAFERSSELGLREVDLLRGSEPYKQRFAPGTRAVVRLRAAHGRAGRIVLALLLLESRARRHAGRAKRRIEAARAARAAKKARKASSTTREPRGAP